MLLHRFWRSHNSHLLTAAHNAAQLASLRAAHTIDSATLDKLERTNVYNDAFCIGHDGAFGTINGLRMGRVPGVPVSLDIAHHVILTDSQVEWAEINAAWGQTLLLLYTIARKLDYSFSK
jgi:beclin